MKNLVKLAPFALQYQFAQLERRAGWLLDKPTPRKLANIALAGAAFGLKQVRVRHWPVVLKLDLSPVCNLRCTVCVHARATETSNDELKAQVFDAKQMMTLAQFRRIVDEVKGKTSAFSLYYLGDPFVHPQLEEMCAIASEAGIATHISSNFSFQLSDERIRAIVESGMTHLTVCVDGLSPETYAKTRVGGRIDTVIENLERVLAVRRELGRKNPQVEVQFIKFQHNAHEVEDARRHFLSLGLDQFTDFWGNLNNYTDTLPGKYKVFAPKTNTKTRTPLCHWPHFMMTIKYNGDAIPCCEFRQGHQYTDDPSESRAVGNVFATSVWDVWTSKTYDDLRRLVSNPERATREHGLDKTFCEGCHHLYETNFDTVQKNADRNRWEDLYTMDRRGRVARKPEAEVHFTDAKKRRLRVIAQDGE